MNKTIIILSLLLYTALNSYSQWYVSRYNVSDINSLSEQQLEESLKNSKTQLLTAGGIALAGGGFFFLAKYSHHELDEEATFFEQVLGEEGGRKLGMFTGAALFVGGSIVSILQIGRIGSIKSAKARNYMLSRQLTLAPALFVVNNSRSYYPGFNISYHF